MILKHFQNVFQVIKNDAGAFLMLNPQTTMRGPLDPTQHSDSCKSETENYLAEIFQVILNGSKCCQMIVLYRTFNVKEIAGSNGPQWSRKWELFFSVV